MSNFKQRVDGLMSTTISEQALTACKEALRKHNEYTTFKMSPTAVEQFESTVAESLIADLDTIDETAVNDFLTVEKRIVGMRNLGVKKALDSLRESDLGKNPSTMYLIEGLLKMSDLPEWMTINTVIEKLTGFEWHPEIKEHINALKVNATKYAEDIKIYSAVHEAKNSSSSFIITGLEKDINAYLNNRTASNRGKLIESLNKYTYDGNVRKLYNTVLESEKSFQLKANSSDSIVTKIYSPVIVTESDEIFAAHGKAYVKRGNDVRPLTLEETAKLPDYFTWVSSFLSSSNVEVSENKIKVYSFDKKVEIVEESEGLKIAINGKSITVDEFHNMYLKSGIFHIQERETINAINKLIENWDSIMELDFAKSIFPKGATHRRVDIFSTGNKMHINSEDTIMAESKFYPDCNATQSRTMVLEFANYDLGTTFKSVLNEEEVEIKAIEEQKKMFLASIEYLQAKKSTLENHPDAEIRESEEIKQILGLIDEEISTAKQGYFELQNKTKVLTTIQEGLGAIAGDEVEYLKKKQ